MDILGKRKREERRRAHQEYREKLGTVYMRAYSEIYADEIAKHLAANGQDPEPGEIEKIAKELTEAAVDERYDYEEHPGAPGIGEDGWEEYMDAYTRERIHMMLEKLGYGPYEPDVAR